MKKKEKIVASIACFVASRSHAWLISLVVLFEASKKATPNDSLLCTKMHIVYTGLQT